MSLYCDIPLPAFAPDICANEEGRIIAIAAVRSDSALALDTTTSGNVENASFWTSAIANSQAVVIQNVRGSKPKSSDVTVDGFGRQQTRSVSRDFTAEVMGPDIVGNEDFFNVLNYDNSHSFWFYTQGGKIWRPAGIGEVCPTANWNADSVVEEGLNSFIMYSLEVAWSGTDIPVAFTAPTGIFE